MALALAGADACQQRALATLAAAPRISGPTATRSGSRSIAASATIVPRKSRTAGSASEAVARRYSHNFLKKYALRARENACFALLTDQVGRAGNVAMWPADSENQPHHAGAALIWGPDGELLASTQEERIREEMIVATLDSAQLARERALANYMLRTRRPELFGDLVREQVDW